MFSTLKPYLRIFHPKNAFGQSLCSDFEWSFLVKIKAKYVKNYSSYHKFSPPGPLWLLPRQKECLRSKGLQWLWMIFFQVKGKRTRNLNKSNLKSMYTKSWFRGDVLSPLVLIWLKPHKQSFLVKDVQRLWAKFLGWLWRL